MSILIPKRILTRRRRRQLANETEARPWRPVRRRALATPPTDPATPAQAAEEPTSEGLERRERRRKRRRLRGRRRTGPRVRFLNIE